MSQRITFEIKLYSQINLLSSLTYIKFSGILTISSAILFLPESTRNFNNGYILDKYDIKYHICENCVSYKQRILTGWMNLMLNLLMFQIQATCNEIFIYLKRPYFTHK